jgi:hypothetical protein
VSSTSVADAFEFGVGVNEAVALINGVTHDWIVESALSAVRKEVHEVEMLDGINVASDYVVSIKSWWVRADGRGSKRGLEWTGT